MRGFLLKAFLASRFVIDSEALTEGWEKMPKPRLWWNVVIKASVVEEAAFRLLPLTFLTLMGVGAHSGLAWIVGIAVSIVFSLTHHKYDDGFPVLQFVYGILFWYLAGYHHILWAILAHMVVNSIALIAWFSLRKENKDA